VTIFACAHRVARLIFQGSQRNRAVFAQTKIRACRKIRDTACRNYLQTKFRQKSQSESQTTPIQPTFNTSKDEETKMAKKVKKAAKKSAKKTVRKATRRPAKKTARKTTRKAKKAAPKKARKTVRKTVRKAAKKTARKPARRVKKARKAAPAAAM